MSNNQRNNGVGFGTVLFLIFLVLKLCNIIDWSWWWVTSPFWIPLVIVLLIFGFVGVMFLVSRRSK